jgi:cytochrome c oxidase subunit IV
MSNSCKLFSYFKCCLEGVGNLASFSHRMNQFSLKHIIFIRWLRCSFFSQMDSTLQVSTFIQIIFWKVEPILLTIVIGWISFLSSISYSSDDLEVPTFIRWTPPYKFLLSFKSYFERWRTSCFLTFRRFKSSPVSQMDSTLQVSSFIQIIFWKVEYIWLTVVIGWISILSCTSYSSDDLEVPTFIRWTPPYKFLLSFKS